MMASRSASPITATTSATRVVLPKLELDRCSRRFAQTLIASLTKIQRRLSEGWLGPSVSHGTVQNIVRSHCRRLPNHIEPLHPEANEALMPTK